MNYQVIFDVAQTNAIVIGGATLVSAVIFCAYPIVFRNSKGARAGTPRGHMLKFLNYLCVFGTLFITLLSIGTRYPKYLRLESALRGSQCQVTTGVVSQFQHLYHQRHLGEGESFVVVKMGLNLSTAKEAPKTALTMSGSSKTGSKSASIILAKTLPA